MRFDPWVGKIPWRRKRQPTPVFRLENPTDRGAWRATAHGVAESWTQLSAGHQGKRGDFLATQGPEAEEEAGCPAWAPSGPPAPQFTRNQADLPTPTV